jgi:UDP-hydrolysing UDP-N-acetyl-D-glucosamine 2-epimerase
MRRVGVITAGRNDFGIYIPVVRALVAEGLEPVVIATGSHMDPRFGETVRDISAAGFSVAYRVPMVPEHDDAASVSSTMGYGMMQLAAIYADARLDLLMILGDRYEMFAAATAAVPFKLPLVHIHGGEITEGAIDEQFRHALTKMSHLHFVSTPVYRDHVLQMGEEPWRVVVCGAPGLDPLTHFVPLPLEALEASLGMHLGAAPFMMTFHPVTLAATEEVDEVLAALDCFPGVPVVITMPNSDVGYGTIVKRLRDYVAVRPNAALFESLGTERYFSLMNYASVMVGNSSSGLIEAASFGLPVVNVGDRQKGRVRGKNVIDVPCNWAQIEHGIQRALALDLRGLINPYGGGHAGEVIAKNIAVIELGERLLLKKFMRSSVCP